MKKLHFLAILVALSGLAQAAERDMVPGRFETSGGGGIAFGDDTGGLATFGFSAGTSRFVSVTGDYFYSADSIQIGKEKVKGRQNDFLGGLNVHLPVKGPPRCLVWVASFLYWAKMKGRRRSAALHSGPDSALGSHPCVALSSGRQLDCKAFGGPPPLWPIRDKSQGARGDSVPPLSGCSAWRVGVCVMMASPWEGCAAEREPTISNRLGAVATLAG